MVHLLSQGLVSVLSVWFFFASTSSQFDFSDPVCQPTLLVWNKSHRKHQQLMVSDPDVDCLLVVKRLFPSAN